MKRAGYEIVRIQKARRRIAGTHQWTRGYAYRVLRGTEAPFIFVGEGGSAAEVDAIIAKDRKNFDPRPAGL